MEGPIRVRIYGPRNTYCVDKSKTRQILFRGRFGDLTFISRKAMHIKVGDNFVVHNFDTEFA
jgi:hypothetical protein